MAERRDAAQGASVFTLAARKVAMQDVADVGDVCFAPGAFNVVPARAALMLEFRAPESEMLDPKSGLHLGGSVFNVKSYQRYSKTYKTRNGCAA